MKRFISVIGLMILLKFNLFGQEYIYVSDAANFQKGPWKIFQFNSDGTGGKVFIEDQLAWPQDILFLEDKNEVLISNLSSGKINRYKAASGELMADFATGIGGPTRMKIGPDGLLYVLQWAGDGKVKRYQLDGSFVDDFTKSGVQNSIGMDWDDLGNLYVSSYNGKFVERFDTTGKSLGKFISTGLTGPTNIYFDHDKNLIVLDYNSGNVKKYDKEGQLIGTMISGIANCEGVDFFENGNIVIGVGSTATVNLYGADGKLIKALIPKGSEGLKTPNAVILRKSISSTKGQVSSQGNFITRIGSNTFQIKTDVLNEKIKMLQCLDASGKVVAVLSDAQDTLWETPILAPGLYIFRAVTVRGNHWHQQFFIE